MVDPRLKALHRLVSEDFDAKALYIVNVIKAVVPEGNQAGAMFLVGREMERVRNESLGIILKGLPDPDEEPRQKQDDDGFFSR